MTYGTSGLPVCVEGGCGITCFLEEEDGVDLVGDVGFVMAFLSCGPLLFGESLLFSLEGLSSSEELDELVLELELELEESEGGVSGNCDGCDGGCGASAAAGGIVSSSGSTLVPVDAARSEAGARRPATCRGTGRRTGGRGGGGSARVAYLSSCSSGCSPRS